MSVDIPYPWRIHVAALLLILVMPTQGIAQADAEPVQVFVSIQPQAFLVDQIAGDDAAVHVVIPPTQNHHTFEVTPRQVAALASARFYFTVGLEFEERIVERIRDTYAGLTIVDTTKGIEYIAQDDDHHHDHGHEDCDHEGLDPHIWLGPREIAIQARTIAEAFMKAYPERASTYEERRDAFLERLSATDRRISEQLAPYRGKAFYVFHPAFGYFAHAYGLEQRAVEVEGKSPSPRQIQTLISQARADDVQVIFVQPQFDSRSAEVIAQAIGGTVTPLNPVEYDILHTLETMADRIEEALAANPS